MVIEVVILEILIYAMQTNGSRKTEDFTVF